MGFKSMTRMGAFLGAAVGALALASTAAALSNEDREVDLVETHSNGWVYIHLKAPMANQPACAKYSRIIACTLDEKYCEPAMSVALAAKLSTRTIDFEVSTECVGQVAQFTRLRVN